MSTMKRTEKRWVFSTLLFLGDGTREQTDSKSSVKMNQKDDNTFPLFQPRIYCRVTCDDRTSTCHLILFVLRRLDCISYWRTRLKVQKKKKGLWFRVKVYSATKQTNVCRAT